MRAFFYTRRVARALLLGAALAALLGLGLWAWQIGARAQALLRTLAALEADLGAADLAAWPTICARAAAVGDAAQALHGAVGPLLPLGGPLATLPGFGPELAAAGPLLAAAEAGAAAARGGCATLATLTAPLPAASPAPAALTARLAAARPALGEVRADLQLTAARLAEVPRSGLDEGLVARLARAEALLARAVGALDLALAAPALLGADGPRSYLVVVQNPDELRPTGGFISAAGIVGLDGGLVSGLDLRDSAVLDSATAAYPLAPEPLRRYMLTEPMGPALWLFRDANWSPDFPTSARQMLELYRLGQGQAADGVLALTPDAVRRALAALGPVRIEGSSRPVSSESVEADLRAAYDAALAQGRPEDRKTFVSRLGQALLERAARAELGELLALAGAAEGALDSRAALIYLPEGDPAAALLAARAWDGAVRPGPHDFLMAVSANVGYNKVGPSIAQNIRYSVDLSDGIAPRGALTVVDVNRSPEGQACAPPSAILPTYAEMTVGCYWNYLRVLVPGEAILSDTEVARVPDGWLLGGDGDGGRVYSEPGPGGTRAYGALVVVPRADRQATTFRYDLPPAVVSAEGRLRRYKLRLQRQPGLAQLATVQVLLPDGAELLDATPAPQSRAGQSFTFELPLETDRTLELVYRVP